MVVIPREVYKIQKELILDYLQYLYVDLSVGKVLYHHFKILLFTLFTLQIHMKYIIAGRLVYERLRDKAQYIPPGSGLPIKLPGNAFTIK